MLYIAFPGPEHTTTEGASEISGFRSSADIMCRSLMALQYTSMY